MAHEKRIPGQFVSSVAAAEIIRSVGIQLALWANDIAFTDAAFGETWSVETANRMACCSELLSVLYKRMPRRSLEIVVDLPEGMVGVISINPDFKDDAPKQPSDDDRDGGDRRGGSSSIPPMPF